MKQTKILILSANPSNTTPLRLSKEIRTIKNGLRLSKNRDHLLIEQAEAIRITDFRRAILTSKPNIIHFCGHGNKGGLVIEDDLGTSTIVSNASLGDFFGLFSNSIELVVLNSCYSEEQANCITRHIPYVIGMKSEIGDRAAIEFSTGFYDAIGAGESIEMSFRVGTNAIAMHNIPESHTPVLLTKKQNQSSDFMENKSNLEGFYDHLSNNIEKLIQESQDKIIAQTNQDEIKTRTLFKRLYKGDELSTLDKRIVRLILKNKRTYTEEERILVVNGLTLGTLRTFSNDKLELLAEYILDKESFVWKEALVGMFIVLITRKRRLKRKLQALLRQLHQDKEIQWLIGRIFILIYSKDYDFQRNYLTKATTFYDEIDGKLNYIKRLIHKRSSEKSEFEVIETMTNKSTKDFIKYMINHGNNLLKINFKKELFLDSPEMWFYPFDSSLKSLIEVASNESIDYPIEDFFTGLELAPFPCIAKYYLAFNFQALSNKTKDFITSMGQLNMMELLKAGKVADFETTIEDYTIIAILSKYHLFYTNYRGERIESPFDEIEEDDRIHKTTFVRLILKPDQVFMREADYLFMKERYFEANKLYKKVYEKDKSNEVLCKLITSYHKCQQFQACIERFQHLDFHQADRAVNLNIAKNFLGLERYNEAEQILEINLARDKEDFESLYILGLCYYGNRKYQKAMGCFEQELELKPSNYTRTLLVNVYLNLGYYEDALYELGQLKSEDRKEMEYLTKMKNELFLKIHKMRNP